MALVRHLESLQIKLLRDLLEFGVGYLTVDDDTYHPFSGCKTLDKSIENDMVKYYRKDGNIILFLKELFSIATIITQDFNFYQSIQYTYVQKVLEPVWIINFLKTLSFFDEKSLNILEFFAFLSSDLYKETKVFDFLGISINNPEIVWENTSNYYVKLSQFLDNLKDYVYKKIMYLMLLMKKFLMDYIIPKPVIIRLRQIILILQIEKYSMIFRNMKLIE